MIVVRRKIRVKGSGEPIHKAYLILKASQPVRATGASICMPRLDTSAAHQVENLRQFSVPLRTAGVNFLRICGRQQVWPALDVMKKRYYRSISRVIVTMQRRSWSLLDGGRMEEHELSVEDRKDSLYPAALLAL